MESLILASILPIVQKTDTILTQIGLCLDKNMKVMSCPSETDTQGCDQDSIYYPPSIYNKNH